MCDKAAFALPASCKSVMQVGYWAVQTNVCMRPHALYRFVKPSRSCHYRSVLNYATGCGSWLRLLALSCNVISSRAGQAATLRGTGDRLRELLQPLDGNIQIFEATSLKSFTPSHAIQVFHSWHAQTSKYLLAQRGASLTRLQHLRR